MQNVLWLICIYLKDIARSVYFNIFPIFFISFPFHLIPSLCQLQNWEWITFSLVYLLKYKCYKNPFLISSFSYAHVAQICIEIYYWNVFWYLPSFDLNRTDDFRNPLFDYVLPVFSVLLRQASCPSIR